MQTFDSLVSLSDSSPYCVYAYCGTNLGDHIQTLAILQHLKVQKLVFRDHRHNEPHLTLVANGWMTHGQFPSDHDFAKIVYAGVHIAPKIRGEQLIQSLRGLLVGARDPETAAYLTAHGVSSTLCRCPTLTFPRYTGIREGVYCVDLEEKLYQRVCRQYSHLGAVTRLTHDLPRVKPAEFNMDTAMQELNRAHDMLCLYEKARLVVTHRIHVALPCLAFGTPVMCSGGDDPRFSVLNEFPEVRDFRSLRWFSLISPWQQLAPPSQDVKRCKENYVEFLRSQLCDENVGAKCLL